MKRTPLSSYIIPNEYNAVVDGVRVNFNKETGRLSIIVNGIEEVLPTYMFEGEYYVKLSCLRNSIPSFGKSSKPVENATITGTYPKYTRSQEPHKGLDFGVVGNVQGSHVYAVMGGTVIQVHDEHPNNFNTNIKYTGVKSIPDWGNYVKIRVDKHTVMIYAHLQQKIEVAEGDVIDSGTLLGYMGNTGNSSGTHLHFEVQVDGTHVNPNDYLPTK